MKRKYSTKTSLNSSLKLLFAFRRYFAIVVYNDELHTYDYVIRTLTGSCSLSTKKASDFATIIDREVFI